MMNVSGAMFVFHVRFLLAVEFVLLARDSRQYYGFFHFFSTISHIWSW